MLHHKVGVNVFIVLALFVAAVLPCAAAAAGGSYVYHPALSLNEAGPGFVDLEDPIPDPGPNHPEPRFEAPCGTDTDRLGNIYISSRKLVSGSTVASRLDVFSSEGKFLSRTEVDHSAGCGLSVDSEGVVYTGGIEGDQVDVFTPSVFPPQVGTKYSLAHVIKPITIGCPLRSLAVDQSNDHLYVGGESCGIVEFGSAAEGSPVLGKFFPAALQNGFDENRKLSGIDLNGHNQDVYAALTVSKAGGKPVSTVLVLDRGDGHIKCEVSGAETPGDLEFGLGASLAVDQSDGHFFVYSIKQGAVYIFDPPSEGECEFVGKLPKPPTLKGDDPLGDIAVDDPLISGEAGYSSPNEDNVYVTSGTAKAASASHLFAYRHREPGPPEIEDQEARDIAETEAVLRAQLNPGDLDTTYHFEYTTQADFDANGYANAILAPVPDGFMSESIPFGPVTAAITGLEPGVAYRFRLVASNCEAEESLPGECLTEGEGTPGGEGSDESFSTYPPSPISPPCPNADLRVGRSASLSDCRAYELVTPPDTNGHVPKISILGLGFGEMIFDSTPISLDGNSAVFGTNSGALPAVGGGGFFDAYRASRDPDLGWQTQFAGLSGAQAERPRPGGISSDHLYSFWNVEEGEGTLANPVTDYAQYLRTPLGIEPSPNCAVESEPVGGIELIGCGSLGGEPQAAGRWISAGGGHVIFDTGGKSDPVQLEPCAPLTGVSAIYDRTPGGPTRCVSVPPADASAETKVLFETKDATYKGASADGTTVVFAVAGVLYARLDNAETVEVSTGNATYAGVSGDGDRVFYLDEATGVPIPRGELFACEVVAGPCGPPGQEPLQIGSGGESVVVNVSADGSHAYFISPKELDGEEGEEGKDNLYAWDGKASHFIGVLDPLDVNDALTGLGRWISDALAVPPGADVGPARDPSRTTPDGTVMVFESRADLLGTGYQNEGHSQVFRYDSEAEVGDQLVCLSCNPTGEVARTDARLQIPEEGQLVSTNPSPVNAITHIPNVTVDGETVFFQSGDRLVPADLDDRLDVYEWMAQDTGGCKRENGCLALISYGRSSGDDYLYAMTPSGSDVLFLTNDVLVGQDLDATPSIYDARVGGGFPVPTGPHPCVGEECQPLAFAPEDTAPASSSFEGLGSVREDRARPRRCPKGKRRVGSKGRGRCVVRRGKHGQRRGRHRANVEPRVTR